MDYDLLPKWKNVKAHEIKRRDIINLLDTIVQRAPIQANRTLALLRKMYNWAISRDLVEINPCTAVKMPAKENRKDRMLTEDEIRIFWDGLTTASMSESTRLCLKNIYNLTRTVNRVKQENVVSPLNGIRQILLNSIYFFKLTYSLCNGQVKPDTFLSHFLIKFPLKI